MSRNLLQPFNANSKPLMLADIKHMQTVCKLASELCDAIDAAEADVGGSRPIKEILGELGPACNKVEGR